MMNYPKTHLYLGVMRNHLNVRDIRKMTHWVKSGKEKKNSITVLFEVLSHTVCNLVSMPAVTVLFLLMFFNITLQSFCWSVITLSLFSLCLVSLPHIRTVLHAKCLFVHWFSQSSCFSENLTSGHVGPKCSFQTLNVCELKCTLRKGQMNSKSYKVKT